MSEVIDLQRIGWTQERSRDWRDRFGEAGSEPRRYRMRPGRVASQLRGRLRLFTEYGVYQAEVSGRLQYTAFDASELPAVGDWVAAELRPDEGAATVHQVLPRSSALIRQPPADRPSDVQVLAANLDTVWVVTSMNRDFNPRRIERTLALVRESGAEGVVVLSKGDLTPNPDGFATRAAEVAAGCAVHCVSALAGGGLDALRPYLAPGRSVALIGSSGVGKSTLVNVLLSRDALETAEIRSDDDRGRHTTTHRDMLPIPGGGVLIDTPGLREVALWSDDDGGIESAFPEIEALFEHCRFHDCGHGSEPGCAVTAALGDGSLDPSRLESYRKLKREAEHAMRRRDARGRHEERQKRRKFAKQLRQRIDKRDRR